ncbi:adenylyltransferase/cytidyltransferase family protein [Campylobacter lari]|nr:adenylyltransferase/cytidyltransferase family protein [Campylobacter lari]
MVTVITFGTFDLFHYGHLRILERASELGNRLVVGVSSDMLNFAKKGRKPICSECERMKIISALKCVDGVFLEESLELKEEYIKKYQANILVMGDDWKGKFDYFNKICDVVYLERTPSISTTEIIEMIKA